MATEQVTLADGSVYTGTLKNGVPEGTGELKYPNGNRYSGEFRAGKFEGTGEFHWSDGQRFEGSYENGVRKKGRFVRAPDQVFAGEFDQYGQLHGQVVYTHANVAKQLVYDHGDPLGLPRKDESSSSSSDPTEQNLQDW